MTAVPARAPGPVPGRPAVPSAEPILSITGAFTVDCEVHGDDRGFFVETYRRQWFEGGKEMVQGNRADRRVGTVVGLHYHLRQADYWYVPYGMARIVLHDLRRGSPTEARTWTTDVGARSGDRHRHTGVYIPPGVAHGFGALTDCTLTYLVDGYYDPDDELGLAWDDPDVGAGWGIDVPILSSRDLANPRLADLPEGRRPRYRPGGGEGR